MSGSIGDAALGSYREGRRDFLAALVLPAAAAALTCRALVETVRR
jgi:hypothetical protein